ncbi:MAG: hypothetical protein AB7O67_21635 [Vicinamibacterales bacterium]
MRTSTRLSLAIALAALALPMGAAAQDLPASHFETSDRCIACHNGVTSATGEDVSIGPAWRASMMANSARDPYWQASVRRETKDHPQHAAEIENECAACHMPMARYDAVSAGGTGGVFRNLPASHAESDEARLAVDGVSCAVCHRMTDERFGTRQSANANFVIQEPAPGEPRKVFGPFEIKTGRASVMRSSSTLLPTEGKHVQRSELCATCHTLITTALGPDGSVVGELPEQMVYWEWEHSTYRTTKSCQDCHMPVVPGETRVSSVLGEQRTEVSRHTFVGANFLIPRMLSAHRTELGVKAQPGELDAAIRRAEAHLAEETATVAVEARRDGDTLVADVAIENLAGHKFPTAYPSRRAWLHVTASDANGRVVFESGRPNGDGSIAGNDNDADAATFEPHYREIRDAGQVQIYEAILRDPAGAVTTGLIKAVGYLKDNRILPHGFDKTTASADVAVHGDALDDGNFSDGADHVRYVIPAGDASGAVTVKVTLMYQPIAYRWAQNLRQQDGEEIDRFLGYYQQMAHVSSAIVASASAVVR